MAFTTTSRQYAVVSSEPEKRVPLPVFCAEEWRQPYKHIVFLTGAGISVPSGLAAFRSEDGLWNNHDADEVASAIGFKRNPALVHAFYNRLRPQFQQAEPNAAHLAIAELQKRGNAKVTVLTQNIDTLHEKAGTIHVYHIHGVINETVCMFCGCIIRGWSEKNERSGCPLCYRIGGIRPNIVFFGEPIHFEEKVQNFLADADLFIAAGTSGLVSPASHFVSIAKKNGARTLEFNLEPVRNSADFDGHIFGDIADTLPYFVKTLSD